MKRLLPLSKPEEGRPPGNVGRPPHRPACRLSQRRLHFPARAGVALSLGLCAVAGSVLVPGLVLGAEAPTPPAQTATAAAGKPVDIPSAGIPLVTLPWGDGPGQVGLVRPAEGLTRGPEALAVAPDGRIVVLDSVNKRIVFLAADGRPEGTADVPLSEPRFLAVDDGRVYVLDCDADRRIATIDRQGAALDFRPLPDLPDVVTGLFATEAGPCVEVAHDSVLVVGSDLTRDGAYPLQAAAKTPARSLAGRPLDQKPSRAVKVTFSPQNGLQIRSFRIDRATLNANKSADLAPSLAAGPTVEHLVSVDSDGGEGLIVGARLVEAKTVRDAAATGRGAACLFLARFASESRGGDPTGTLLLTESTFAYLGQPYVVAPDGRVFQPVADESGYTILVHSFPGADTPLGSGEVLP